MKSIDNIGSHFKQNRAFYIILIINLLLTMIIIILAQSCHNLDSKNRKGKNYIIRSFEIVQGGINNQMVCNPFGTYHIFAEKVSDTFNSESDLSNRLLSPHTERITLMIISIIIPYPWHTDIGFEKYKITNKGYTNFNCQYYEN